MVIVSKFDGACTKCGKRIQIGDRVDWVKGIKGVWCLSCAPKGGRPMPDASQPANVPPAPAVPVQAPIVVSSLPPAWAACECLETQLVRIAAKSATPHLESCWRKFESAKALASRANTPKHEQRLALKTALTLLVSAIFSEEAAYV